jgi:FAD/FMN-containing dehydrogenase/Fe-S oxidoreductase
MDDTLSETETVAAAGDPAAPARGAKQAPFSQEAADALAEDLYDHISGEVRFEPGSRALYATDASNYRQIPIGVVIPKTVEDVIATVAACKRHGAPLLSRGGGTSLAGQCCNAAVIMDMSKRLNGILELDPEKRLARVQPGVVLDHLRDAAIPYGLTFGPDPATHNHCTLGGMIGNNSCGAHSVMAGKTLDNLHTLDILTYRGERMMVGAAGEDELAAIIEAGGPRARIYGDLRRLRDRHIDEIRHRMPKLPRRSSGFNLDQLLPENGFHVARALAGTESSCVTILEATVRLVHHYGHRTLVVLGYPDVYTAGDHVTEIMEYGPIALEGLDDKLIGHEARKRMHTRDLPLLPQGSGWLMVEFGGESREESDGKARAMLDRLKGRPDAPRALLYDDKDMEARLWEIREAGLGATARAPGDKDTWEGWEDSSVPPEKLGGYLRDLRKLFGKYGYGCALYGHFGQGCVHTRIDFDLVTRGGIDHFRSFLGEAADLCVSSGGSLSGEHGDGQSRAELLPKMYGDALVQAFREFKAIWDPDGMMNPGKAIDAYPITSNLRLGTEYHPALPRTHFRFDEDQGSLARAAERCVGIGECRRMEKGTMCPSYRATMEEKHSTRGRAHLLFEMLRGDFLPDGFRSEAVKESLDLCLACKGCKHDCPVQVDVATYKAEFLSHYYQGRIRPRQAYSMGLIHWNAKAAALAPGFANAFVRAPLLGRAAKWIGGIDPARALPAFAPVTFMEWYRKGRGEIPRREGADPGRILLWVDTFNNHFSPEIAASALEVLEATGHRVEIVGGSLCCGRPLYDFGMLDLAERLLRRTLDRLRPEIRAGIPVVGLEPSCISVFRDELPNLLGGDLDAIRLSKQTFTLDEFLMRECEGFRPPKLDAVAIVHGHCHQKAVLDIGPQRKLLEAMGVGFAEPETGCCGMAGSFGFEAGKYRISSAIGERHLLPSIRRADGDTLILANGFSCREQIRSVPGADPLHVAQVLHKAMAGNEAAEALRREIRNAGPSVHSTGRRLLRGAVWAAAAAAIAYAFRKAFPGRPFSRAPSA